MAEMQSADFAARVGDLAEALLGGVLRALAARKEFVLPPGSTIGGCTPIGDGDDCAKMRVAVTIASGPQEAK